MKKSIFTLAIMICAVLFSSEIGAQEFKPLDKSPMDVASFPDNWREPNKVVKITYSRPQLKGRSVDKLAPKGSVWRTGANEAAEITFYKDVVFGGEKVKAGSYSLFTIPGEKEWTIILNTAKNVWGAYTYKQEEDVLRVMAKVTKNNKSVEAFSIMFDKDMNLVMGWDKIVVTVPIQ